MSHWNTYHHSFNPNTQLQKVCNNIIALKFLFVVQRKYMSRKFLRNERIILKCALSLLFIQTSGL